MLIITYVFAYIKLAGSLQLCGSENALIYYK